MALRDTVAGRGVSALWASLTAGLTLAATASAHGQAQPVTWALDTEHMQVAPADPRVVADLDDDDDDGVADATQPARVPLDDLARLRLWPARPPGAIHLQTHGGLRLVDAGGRVLGRAAQVPDGAPLPRVQGTEASTEAQQDSLDVSFADGRSTTLPVAVVGLTFLNADSAPFAEGQASLGVSQRVTHDRSLPRDPRELHSSDPENFRVGLQDVASTASPHVSIESVEPSTGAIHHVLRHVPLVKPPGRRDALSPFLRLVGDRTDRSAPEVGERLLQVSLRERVRVRYRVGPSELSQDVPVGAREGGDPRRIALRGKLRLRALRMSPGGPTVIGHSDMAAIGLLQEQVEVANEIWLQCGIDFGPPWQADAEVVDPPPAGLLAIADPDGLRATGGGQIRLRAAGRDIGPVRTQSGATPVDTALAVAEALTRKGFVAQVTHNPKTEFGAGPSADVTVRDARGRPVALSEWRDVPLSTDATQQVRIGRVDLRDGVQQFDNMTASAGTLEERTLIKLLADDDPKTIDVFVINRFASPERQGEAFIEGDGGSIVNTLILDRNGVRYQRQAWVQAHELGHVLLDAPYHPDNIGPDRPWLLMDADARQGRVTGPKRLTADECERVRRRSGPGAKPALLTPLAR